MSKSNGNGSLVSASSNRIAGLEVLPAPKPPAKEIIRITAPNMKRMTIKIIGTAPYLQCRFPEKAMLEMHAKHEKGSHQQAGKKVKRAARDFQDQYKQSSHRLNAKEYGIPATAFRQAAKSACRLVDFKMTLLKLSLFIEQDGYDVVDNTPLVKINGKPEYHEMIGRNATGVCDLRVRTIWREWSASVTVRFDEDQFSASDVFNLFCRIGEQVGIGEGRPDSRESCGMGMGTFRCEL